MEAGFAGLRSDMDRLRYEFKSDVENIEHEMKEITQGLNSAQGDVEMLKEKIDKDLKETTSELDALRSKVVDLELRLNAEIENNIRLEQYTRRENLRFNNINESDGEDCKAIVYSIIDNDLGIGRDGIRFHAVHRVGKKVERFVSREDRDEVWKNRSKIKNSGNHTDAYITEDFAKAIQEERKILIKAMLKERNEHGIRDAKVVGRFLFIHNEKYSHQHFPAFLR